MIAEVCTKQPATRAASLAWWDARCDARGSHRNLDRAEDR